MSSEMDRSRLKRPETQKMGQTTKNTFGGSHYVPRVYSRHIATGDVDNSMDTAEASPSTAPVTQIIDPAALVRQVPMDMDLPGEESHLHQIRLMRRKKWYKVRLVVSRGLALALVVLITLGGLLFSQSYFKINKVFNGTTGSVAALKPNVNPDLLNGEGSGRVNVLLLGREGGTHKGADLTNSMMVASIDPVNDTMTLLSLPKDLWVNVSNAGVMKINAAWQKGEVKYYGKNITGSTNPKAIDSGFKEVDQAVNQVLGINIDYNVLVNFQAFEQAVNTVGGVTVNVPTPLVDPTMAWQNSKNPVLAQAGVQNFDGEQALLYVMSRETTSDFARAQRQRSVVVALKNKIETLGTLSNPVKISSLINAFGNNVVTDLSLSDASQLYGILEKIDTNKITSSDLATAPNQYVTTGNIAGQSIVLPTAGLFNYGQIQQYVRGLLKDPYILKENAKIMVLNGTNVPGVATNEANELKTYGYNVVGVANTPTSNWTHTTLVNLTKGKDQYTQHYLEERFNTQAINHLSGNSIPTNGADFVIIIGSNEVNSTQAQAN
jgi:polyisoprenyl-teichoic acid--peptidoglycan teichoic acid transferase